MIYAKLLATALTYMKGNIQDVCNMWEWETYNFDAVSPRMTNRKNSHITCEWAEGRSTGSILFSQLAFKDVLLESVALGQKKLKKRVRLSMPALLFLICNVDHLSRNTDICASGVIYCPTCYIQSNSLVMWYGDFGNLIGYRLPVTPFKCNN